jgi:hypothetical protein
MRKEETKFYSARSFEKNQTEVLHLLGVPELVPGQTAVFDLLKVVKFFPKSQRGMVPASPFLPKPSSSAEGEIASGQAAMSHFKIVTANLPSVVPKLSESY